MFADSSTLSFEGVSFERNVGGDGLPSDEWSDGGGALYATSCFGLLQMTGSRLTGNKAHGGSQNEASRSCRESVRQSRPRLRAQSFVSCVQVGPAALSCCSRARQR